MPGSYGNQRCLMRELARPSHQTNRALQHFAATLNRNPVCLHTPGCDIQSEHQPDATRPAYISAMAHAFAPVIRGIATEDASGHLQAQHLRNWKPTSSCNRTQQGLAAPRECTRAVRLALLCHDDCTVMRTRVPRAHKSSVVMRHCTRPGAMPAMDVSSVSPRCSHPTATPAPLSHQTLRASPRGASPR